MVSLKEYLGEETYKKLTKKLRKGGGSFDTIAYTVTNAGINKVKVENAKVGDMIGAEEIVLGVGKGKAEKTADIKKKNTFSYSDTVNRILSYLTMNELLDKADDGVLVDEDNSVYLFIAYVPSDPRLKRNEKGNYTFNASAADSITESGWISIHVDPHILPLEEINEDMIADKYVVVLGRVWESEYNERKYKHCSAYTLLIAE